MSSEDFSTFLACIVAADGWSIEHFMNDLGEALLLEGALQPHEWTMSKPTRI